MGGWEGRMGGWEGRMGGWAVSNTTRGSHALGVIAPTPGASIFPCETRPCAAALGAFPTFRAKPKPHPPKRAMASALRQDAQRLHTPIMGMPALGDALTECPLHTGMPALGDALTEYPLHIRLCLISVAGISSAIAKTNQTQIEPIRQRPPSAPSPAVASALPAARPPSAVTRRRQRHRAITRRHQRRPRPRPAPASAAAPDAPPICTQTPAHTTAPRIGISTRSLCSD